MAISIRISERDLSVCSRAFPRKVARENVKTYNKICFSVSPSRMPFRIVLTKRMGMKGVAAFTTMKGTRVQNSAGSSRKAAFIRNQQLDRRLPVFSFFFRFFIRIPPY